MLKDQYIETELKLLRMKELSNQIKELEAEFSMLKDEVIQEFFITTNLQDYKTDKGLVLASRIQYIESRFNSTKFRSDFPDIYDGYKEEKTTFKFLLK